MILINLEIAVDCPAVVFSSQSFWGAASVLAGAGALEDSLALAGFASLSLSFDFVVEGTRPAPDGERWSVA